MQAQIDLLTAELERSTHEIANLSAAKDNLTAQVNLLNEARGAAVRAPLVGAGQKHMVRPVRVHPSRSFLPSPHLSFVYTLVIHRELNLISSTLLQLVPSGSGSHQLSLLTGQMLVQMVS